MRFGIKNWFSFLCWWANSSKNISGTVIRHSEYLSTLETAAADSGPRMLHVTIRTIRPAKVESGVLI
jgi:hypothetical protein